MPQSDQRRIADRRQCNENAFDVTAAILSRNFCAKKF